jgi:transposase
MCMCYRPPVIEVDKTCPECGFKNESGATLCAECGAKLAAFSLPTSAPGAPSAPIAPGKPGSAAAAPTPPTVPKRV